MPNKFDLDGDKILWKKEDCWNCNGKGFITPFIRCESCDGNSRYWKRKKCNVCKNEGLIQHPEKVCPSCNGEKLQTVTRYSHTDLKEFPLDNWEFKFKFKGGELAEVEYFFGAGFYSVVDYGRIFGQMQKNPDETKMELIQKVFGSSHQFSKFVDENDNVQWGILFLISTNGYSVLSYSKEK